MDWIHPITTSLINLQLKALPTVEHSVLTLQVSMLLKVILHLSLVLEFMTEFGFAGSIIFGGIDTMKYTGALEKRPIIPYYQAPDYYPR